MASHTTSDRAQRRERLSLRTSAHQTQLIRNAAAAVDKTVTDFVLESAMSSAERVLTDRTWFVLSAPVWDDLQTLLDAPVERTPKLAALLGEPTVFDASD